MSYINEALRRAQREKDAGNYKNRGILSKTGRKSGFMSGRWIWIGPAFLILLAFALYSWLDFRGKTSQPVSKIKEFPATPFIESMTSANDFYEKARFFHKNGRLSDARAYYQKALMLDPELVPALKRGRKWRVWKI
jgi:tetratricopeptide (TPR) repeat protein